MILSAQSRSRRVATVAIDYRALLHNLKRVKQYTPNSRIIAVIKANAYGHGMLDIAEQLASSDSENVVADAFAVAMLAEAIELREAGITLPIIVFHGFSDERDLALMEQYELQPAIHQLWQLELLEKHFTHSLDVWLKVDTGMHRLGLPVDIIDKAIDCLNECENIGYCRVMSHFANADDIDNVLNNKQISQLVKVNASHDAELSMANSAAIVSRPDSHLDWVRPGIMLYGSSPLIDKSAEELELKAVMQFETHLLAINDLKAGDSIGYGSSWTCPQDMKVGVVAAGYGDGYPRSAINGTPVWLNGKRCELVGRVSMDSLCVDLRGVEAKPGDRVVLWGKELAVDDVASSAGTISYELLCSAGNAAGLK